MRFENPLWFLALAPLAVWIFFRLRSPFAGKTFLPFSDLSFFRDWIRKENREERFLDILKTAAVVLLIVALARPQKLSLSKEPPRPLVDIMLCLDTSASMSALDFDPLNRLEAAKKAAEDFIRKRISDRIGLVVFGGRAMMQCPLTLDHETLVEFLRTIPMNATETDGTAIGTALSLASSRLSGSEAKTKIIILLTDGRSNAGNIDPATAASAAADLGVKIYAVGCAVPGGGLVPVEDPLFGKRLVRMAEDLDEGTLLEVARVTGGKYYRVTSAEKFKNIYDEIDAMEKTKIDVKTVAQAKDYYLPFLLASVCLLFGGMVLGGTVWRTVP